MKTCLSLCLIISVLTACNNDQQTIRDLTGTWELTGQTHNGVPEDPASYEGTTLKFENCKNGKEDCNGFMSNTVSHYPFTYTVYDDGKKIRMTANGLGATFDEDGDIVSQTKAELELLTRDALKNETGWKLKKKE